MFDILFGLIEGNKIRSSERSLDEAGWETNINTPENSTRRQFIFLHKQNKKILYIFSFFEYLRASLYRLVQ